MEEFLIVQNRRVKIYKPRREHEANRNFKNLFRFEPENVEWIADYFLGEIEETRGGSMSNYRKMKTFLHFAGDHGFQYAKGEVMGVHQSTVSRTIYEVGKAIALKSNDWIRFPTTREQMQEAKDLWQNHNRFPDAIGIVDGTHIRIERPRVNADDFYNRKKFFSLNVQASSRYTSVDCGWPGSVHDARVWRNSFITDVMAENRAGAILLADKAYELAPWLMTPYRNGDTIARQDFNRLHASERSLIERVFGQTKSRFPVLKHQIRLKLERVPTIVVSCCVLHNVAKHLQDEDFPERGNCFFSLFFCYMNFCSK